MTSLPDAPEPTHRLRIDTEALAHNWRALDALSGKAETGAAVKANCYGLGVDTCVPVLRDAGCEHFFVAHWSEVHDVLKHVPAEQIAVLHGPLNSAEVDFAIALGVCPVINSIPQAIRWVAGGGGVCHLMVDTGINRLGVSPDELESDAVQALDIDILMSHLASADEDGDTNALQLEAFRASFGKVTYRRLSLSNSAGIALGEDFAVDVTRPGLALYGGIPRRELADKVRQVAYIEAAIIQVREIGPGDRIGYNGEFTASKPMRIGTVSLGYADGFLRARGPGCNLRHGGRSLPLLGKVSMDMIVVDLTNASHVGEGDWLDVPFDLQNAAQQSSVSQYELLTVLGRRLHSR
ncbi:alanine racemase [Erythrobacter ani]|uniref:alanine racemase n=1 Tax=Erythrobacter ani TaxID=2827235 RepID=A0ABS6SR10_9SPHN|nr:alanine racemase [Erythrobacter ani]MBV7267069.1 alanine racemase [Erythrobacter ani]